MDISRKRLFNTRGNLNPQPVIRIVKNTNLLYFSKLAALKMDITLNMRLGIGLNELEKDWYMFENPDGQKIRLHDKKGGQQPIPILSNVILANVLREHYGLKKTDTMTLYVHDAILINGIKCFKLASDISCKKN